MSENKDQKLCGFQGAHVVVSEYNNNGECACLGCPGCNCPDCEHYKDLLHESAQLEQMRLERCINCIKQR